MTTYNTGNPVGSTDARDLYENSIAFDEAINSLAEIFKDRFGRTRRTIAGFEADAVNQRNIFEDAAAAQRDSIDMAAILQRENIKNSADLVLAGIGYAPPFAYVPGISLTLVTQTVSYNGVVYAPKIENLPFTTSGNFESEKFRLIHGVSSVDLMAGSGSSMVGYDELTVQDVLDSARPMQSYTQLRAYTGRASSVRITTHGISGYFLCDATDTTSIDNGGSILIDALGRRWKRIFSGAGMVRWFGADNTGFNDSSPAIMACIKACKHAVVESGVFRCDGMIEIKDGETLELLGGAQIRRYSVYSASIDPVVWLKNSGASFYGSGQASSTVYSENRCPRGVVRIGHKDITESHATVTYCTLRSMTISGGVSYGQTTGDPDVALYMPNAQFSGRASYFHTVFGIRVQRSNIGIWLHGWANGNTISHIQGYQIGNTTLGVNKNVFIFCNGALDNSVSNVFFHSSPNSIGLLVDNFDNTANGGSVHSVYANSFVGMVFEQGGASALGLKSLVSNGASFYEIRHNVSGGNSVPEGFSDNNVFIGLSGISCGNFNPLSINARDYITASGSIKGGSIEAEGDTRTYGAIRSGNGTTTYVAKKVKSNSTANAATVSFTLSNTAQASLYRYGYVYIKVAGGDNAYASSPVAWFMYRAHSLAQAYPSVSVLKDSGGDTASYTVTDAGNGVITISSTQDVIVCELEYGFTTGNVNIT